MGQITRNDKMHKRIVNFCKFKFKSWLEDTRRQYSVVEL